MSDYIKREDAIQALHYAVELDNAYEFRKVMIEYIEAIPSADVMEGDKAQKEIDYWHDKAQSYEQTILKLSLNKADVVEVVRCRDCKYATYDKSIDSYDCFWSGDSDQYTEANDFCSFGERR